ncbi:IS66 family transposase [Bradyrhizobium sp. 25ACV]
MASFERCKMARPLPEHLARERIMHPVPGTRPCRATTECASSAPRQWKVIQHLREKFVCRAREAITRSPALSHPIARGRAWPRLLTHALFAKCGLHLPLNRQSSGHQREGIDLDVPALADWAGAAPVTMMALVDAIRSHVFAPKRIHADDTTVPVLPKEGLTGQLWPYVRHDRPFGCAGARGLGGRCAGNHDGARRRDPEPCLRSQAHPRR